MIAELLDLVALIGGVLALVFYLSVALFFLALILRIVCTFLFPDQGNKES